MGGICRATFVARQSCSVLHSAEWHSVDALLRIILSELPFTFQRLHNVTLCHPQLIFLTHTLTQTYTHIHTYTLAHTIMR